MGRRGQVRIIVIAGGTLIFLQSLIHSFLGHPSITGATQKNIADIIFWAWFAVGLGLASFGLLAVYVASGLALGSRWALVISVAIGATTLLILVPTVFIGIGYPVAGIIGGLLLLSPLLWAGQFNER